MKCRPCHEPLINGKKSCASKRYSSSDLCSLAEEKARTNAKVSFKNQVMKILQEREGTVDRNCLNQTTVNSPRKRQYEVSPPIVPPPAPIDIPQLQSTTNSTSTQKDKIVKLEAANNNSSATETDNRTNETDNYRLFYNNTSNNDETQNELQQSLIDIPENTDINFNDLPPNVIKYIKNLKDKLKKLESTNSELNSQLERERTTMHNMSLAFKIDVENKKPKYS